MAVESVESVVEDLIAMSDSFSPRGVRGDRGERAPRKRICLSRDGGGRDSGSSKKPEGVSREQT